MAYEQSESYRDALKQRVSNWLTDVRYGTGLMPSARKMADMKAGLTNEVLPVVHRELHRRLTAEPQLVENEAALAEMLTSTLNLMRGLETERLETDHMKNTLPLIEPWPRVLGHRQRGGARGRKTITDTVYDSPLHHTLARLMRRDQRVLHDVLGSQSAWWTASRKSRDDADFVIADHNDGAFFRGHDGLGDAVWQRRQPVWTPESGEPLLLSLGLFFDGFGIVNSLGEVRNLHTIGGFYVFINNINKDARFKLEYLLPVVYCNELDVKRYGAQRVFSGADSTGKILDAPFRNNATWTGSCGEILRGWDRGRGIELELPLGPNGQLIMVPTRAYLTLVIGDHPGVASLTYFKESVSAHLPDRSSLWNRTDKHAYSASMYTQQPAFLNTDAAPQLHALRTIEGTEAVIREAEALLAAQGGKTKAEERLKKAGINCHVSALQKSLIPGFDQVKCAGQDPFHLHEVGLGPRMVAKMLYMMYKYENIDTETLNAAIEHYTGWPAGHQLPYIHQLDIEEGAVGSVPKPTAHMRWKGAQTDLFIRHSVILLGPLVNQATLYWKCHLRFVEMHSWLYRPQYTRRTDIAKFGRVIVAFHRAHEAVPEYANTMVPKFVFNQATPWNTEQLGPPGVRSTKRCEAKHQELKHCADNCNYINPVRTIADTMCIRDALRLHRLTKCTGTWSESSIARVVSYSGADLEPSNILCIRLGQLFAGRDVVVSEVAHVWFAGFTLFAHESWVVHSSHVCRPAIAQLGHIVEVIDRSSGARQLFAQFLRLSSLHVVLGGGGVMEASEHDMSCAYQQCQDRLDHLPNQRIQLLSCVKWPCGTHQFTFA